ncbi:MAG TPA: hypothetical protein VE978_13925 [Chitinophagales bacterium]|nr:hypothetical protein [Chitinophagales bacterium]
MTRQLFILTLLLASTVLPDYGQTCTHSELSKTYNFVTTIKKIKTIGELDSSAVVIKVKDKINSKTVCTIRFSTRFLFDSSYIHCGNARSYTTEINRNMQVLDWDYGDIIVADFNFDDREDFAIKKAEGGNGGPVYDYYIQNSDSTFIIDKFLSNTLSCFPNHFNKTKKTLTTICRATTITVTETVYRCDSLTGKWSMISNRYIDIRNK